MRRHVNELVKRHRLTLKKVARGNEYAIREDRVVGFPPITGPASYLCALHEIAHIVSPPARYPAQAAGRVPRKVRPRVLNAEVAAWAWAISKAKVPIPYWMFQRVASALAGYKGWTAT